jgi:hypothetical protein
VGAPVPAQAARRDAGAHHALHGRGRAAVRPAGRDGPRQDRGRGFTAPASSRSTRPARSWSFGSATRPWRPWPASSAGIGDRTEGLPDRILIYAEDGDAAADAVQQRQLAPSSVLVRRSSLEDVFLR